MVINILMNQLLISAFQKAQTLPDDRQSEVGEMLLAIVEQDASSLRLSGEQQAEVRRRLARGEASVPAAEMHTFFRTLVK
jgi:hypothetical protein